ncbi:hypothetical protein PHYSODRAFT_332138 [Phytophthora sojae]|uniref:Uncharacterized protein n=1 Tax=Phytophthora sojae (strain P6497) TaxID=1094619 RepID=G4ZCV8_PHYSP|nr:hypothetical protein PHYSODRAFT_332138 [Phytophthora sojae]EGZ18316.1 hypothetical protein PHYSODRAFT_332138 [Phytophthora sojae]|eukprot:XP_009527374.1 hypothetical protein PHYSODRAFT_332138 [Phytophthora sojae]
MAPRRPVTATSTADGMARSTTETVTADNTARVPVPDENSEASTTMMTGSAVTATNGRRRAKQTATAATRRRERLRERDQRRVHWAATVTNDGDTTRTALSAG